MPLPPSLAVQWYDKRAVGQVVTPGVTEFGYEQTWLQTNHNLSPLRVPFEPALYKLTDPDFDFLPGFLSDCLPDQWGRRIMATEFEALGIKTTPQKMLAWVGSRGIGALRFEPALGETGTTSSWEPVLPLLLAREAQAVMRQAPAEAFATLLKAGTAGGAFPKVTVALLQDGTFMYGGDVGRTPLGHGARLGLLKIDAEDNPARPTTDGRLECAYMNMARAAGIRTAKCEVICDPSGERTRYHLFVERFDCVDAFKRRLHVLTLAGATEAHGLTYPRLLEATRELTADRREMTEVVRRMIFNVRAANADDHGKNHSFLYDEVLRSWSLSPAYDLTLNYSNDRMFSGLFPNTFGPQPRLAALQTVALNVGMTSAEFAAIDEDVSRAIGKWTIFAKEVGLPEKEIGRATSLHAQMAESLAQSSGPTRPRKRKPIW
ncbi:type II toxin-antitoxin system HipA family toxin [Nibricoccus sp. IMCC34717]|uniref:type II toxin-antitoxin system HipA family toxin n=1 Tax=Nibricoccus sp. IMCC34717 TaxID=3034021 RepID=UPI0038500DAC